MKKIFVVIMLLSFSLVLVSCGKKSEKEAVNIIDSENDTCSINGWNLVNMTGNWNGSVCVFDDESFCSLDDFNNWNCQKWTMFFDGEIDSNESVSDVEECDKIPQEIVCGKDWNTYFNRCYLNASWVEEETELAHVENWECIFW